MNKSININAAKLNKEEILKAIVYKSKNRLFQFLTILKILSNLKTLITEIFDDPESSVKPIMTTRASKLLKPSKRYYLKPKP